jgi:anti-sigma regulatory factor (Ser/Thr protein kinase)
MSTGFAPLFRLKSAPPAATLAVRSERAAAMTRLDANALTAWITTGATDHSRSLSRAAAERFGVSRPTARKALARLVEQGWLVREGSRSRPVYRPGVLREVTRTYPLATLEEHLPWARDFAHRFELVPNVAAIARHAFGELLNNAIDHSSGNAVSVSMRQNRTHLHLLVSDDGCGVFDRIRSAYDIDDPQQAMLELAKGKLTTQPQRHSGRGLYFTSRLFDVFDLHANTVVYQHTHWSRQDWLRRHPLQRPGTSIFASIALDSARTVDEVYRAHSTSDSTLGFDRTVVPLRLAADAQGTPLESRSQARRVLTRLHEFCIAELDFEGVTRIGQGFADEVFRVFAAEHRHLRLVPVNMNADIAATVRGVAL